VLGLRVPEAKMFADIAWNPGYVAAPMRAGDSARDAVGRSACPAGRARYDVEDAALLEWLCVERMSGDLPPLEAPRPRGARFCECYRAAADVTWLRAAATISDGMQAYMVLPVIPRISGASAAY
jgi:hypothetical protein